jgi:hypothetical protein
MRIHLVTYATPRFRLRQLILTAEAVRHFLIRHASVPSAGGSTAPRATIQHLNNWLFCLILSP